MKAPTNGFVANSGGEGERKSINSELWHACAGPLVSLPPVGSLVVYFPQGHSEQVAASMQKEADCIPNYPNLPSKLICMLHNVTLHADSETDEVYAQMTLQPVSKYDNDALLASDLGLKQNRQPAEFFCKTLTASDTSTHGGFSVPRRAAEKIFPPLDFSMQPPAQEIVARDLHDSTWTFRHIYRGQPKRHLLTTGWSVFVSTKRLFAGDSVLFIRDEKAQLQLGIRRANRQQPTLSSSVISSDSMHIGILAAAAHAAANNSPFSIFYNPRASPCEFVTPFAKYNKAMYSQVSLGMRFRMMFETEESGVRRYMGTITGISDLDPVRWKGSQWRNLQVGWDESTSGEKPSRVSIWEIEPVVTPFYLCPPPFFRPKFPKQSGFPDDESDMENALKRGVSWLGDDFGMKDAANSVFPGMSLVQWMNMQQNNQFSATQSGFLPSMMSSGAIHSTLGADDPSKLLSFQNPVLSPASVQFNKANQQSQLTQFQQTPLAWPQQQQQLQQLLQNQVNVKPQIQQPQQLEHFQQHQQQLQEQQHHQRHSQQTQHQQQQQQQQQSQWPKQQPQQQSQLPKQQPQPHSRPPQQSHQPLQQQQPQPQTQPQHQQHQPRSQQQLQQQLLPPQHHQSQQQQLQQQLLPPQHHQSQQQQQQQQQKQIQQSLVNCSVLGSNQVPNQTSSQPFMYSQLQHQLLASNIQPQRSNPPAKDSFMLSSLPQDLQCQQQLDPQSSLLQKHQQPLQHSPQNLLQNGNSQRLQPQPQVLQSAQQSLVEHQLQLHMLQKYQQQQQQEQQRKQQQQQQQASPVSPRLHPLLQQQQQIHLQSQQSSLVTPAQHQQQPVAMQSQQFPLSQSQGQNKPLTMIKAHSGLTDGDAPSCSTSPSTNNCQIPQATFFKGNHQAPNSLVGNSVDPSNTGHDLLIKSDIPVKNELSCLKGPDSLKNRGNTTDQMEASSSATSYCLDAGNFHPNFSLPSLLDGDVQSNPRTNLQFSATDGLTPDVSMTRGFDSSKDLQNFISNYGGTPRDIETELSTAAISSQSFGVPDMSFKPGCSGDVAINDAAMLGGGIWSNQTQRMRTYTKVQKRGSVGRSIDVTRYKGYDELRRDLARMFGIEGQLEDPQRTDWKLVYVDHESDILLVGDDPWEEFVSCVQSIKILSSSEVQQMSLNGDLGGHALITNQACSGTDSGNTWRGNYDDTSATFFNR